MLSGDQWTHVQTAGCASANFQSLNLRNQLGHQRVGYLIAYTNSHRDGHATLATRTIGGAHQGAYSVIHIGIWHQYCVVFGPT
ncbi:hypothetical protein D3C76_1478310 [compost metagenome]